MATTLTRPTRYRVAYHLLTDGAWDYALAARDRTSPELESLRSIGEGSLGSLTLDTAVANAIELVKAAGGRDIFLDIIHPDDIHPDDIKAATRFAVFFTYDDDETAALVYHATLTATAVNFDGYRAGTEDRVGGRTAFRFSQAAERFLAKAVPPFRTELPALPDGRRVEHTAGSAVKAFVAARS